MGFIIDDGRGGGYSARVDTDHLLNTRSVQITEESHVSTKDGESYFANTSDTANTLTTSTGETIKLLYLKNDSTTDLLVIHKIFFSVSVTGGVLLFVKNPTLGSVGANNAHTPVNINFRSGSTASVTCHNWDESGVEGISGISGGTTVNTYIPSAGVTAFPIEGSFVLGQSNSIMLTYINNTGGNTEVTAGIRFYMQDADRISR